MVRALAAHHGDLATVQLEDLHRDTMGDAPWATLLVAVQVQEPVGYALLCPLIQLQYGARGMDMHHLFVRPDQRGKGLSHALIDASLNAARAAHCRYLTVGTQGDNRVAQRVYLRAGFDPLPPPGPRFRIKL
ncbi:MAG: GNAT family N-acetyltransferase [Sulfitobacter sp.]|nr:GNAT family N-acetyltransferase [Sulfitobacter sp.]